MSEEIKKQYLNYPDFCPICNSTNIVEEGFDKKAGIVTEVYRYMKCDFCKGFWTEFYTLTDIQIP